MTHKTFQIKNSPKHNQFIIFVDASVSVRDLHQKKLVLVLLVFGMTRTYLTCQKCGRMHIKLLTITKWKENAHRRHKHCTLAVVRQSQKFSPRRRPPSRRCETAKIKSAGDGHYLYLQTKVGEDRCTQFWVIVVTEPPTHKHAHPPTDRTDYNTLRCS